jgi:hypothetical protein
MRALWAHGIQEGLGRRARCARFAQPSPCEAVFNDRAVADAYIGSPSKGLKTIVGAPAAGPFHILLSARILEMAAATNLAAPGPSDPAGAAHRGRFAASFRGFSGGGK